MKEHIKKKENPAKIHLIMLFLSIAAICTILVSDLFIFLNFKADSRIIMHYPVADSSYPLNFKAAGFAWDKDSIEKGKDIEISINLTRLSDGKNLVFKVERSAVHNGPQILFRLAAFSSAINLPEARTAEKWIVTAKMTAQSGRVLETAPRIITVNPVTPNHEFRMFSIQHIIVILMIILSSAFLFALFGKSRNKNLRPYFSYFLVFSIFASEIPYHWYWAAIGGWSTTSALMIQMCGLAILLIPFAHFTRNEKFRQYLAELIYFWGLGGAVQAVLTPDISVHGFPELKFFCFFISHGLIILNSIFIILVYNIKIRLTSYIRVIILTNITIGFMFIINYLLKFISPFEPGNYFVVSYPPPDGSIIDLLVQIFGPSPRYVIGLELLGAVIFGLLCLPFVFSKQKAVNQGIKKTKLVEANERIIK